MEGATAIGGRRDRIGFVVARLPDRLPAVRIGVGQATRWDGGTHIEAGQGGRRALQVGPGGHKEAALVERELGRVAPHVADNLELEGIGRGAPPAQHVARAGRRVAHAGVERAVHGQPFADVVVFRQVRRPDIVPRLRVKGKEVDAADQAGTAHQHHAVEGPCRADAAGPQDEWIEGCHLGQRSGVGVIAEQVGWPPVAGRRGEGWRNLALAEFADIGFRSDGGSEAQEGPKDHAVGVGRRAKP